MKKKARKKSSRRIKREKELPRRKATPPAPRKPTPRRFKANGGSTDH